MAVQVMKETPLPVALTMRMGPTGDHSDVSPAECAVRLARAGTLTYMYLHEKLFIIKTLQCSRFSAKIFLIRVQFFACKISHRYGVDPMTKILIILPSSSITVAYTLSCIFIKFKKISYMNKVLTEPRTRTHKLLTNNRWAHNLYMTGADIVGVNCSFDPDTSLETIRLMKQGLEDAGLGHTYLMTQPVGFHCPDAVHAKDGYHVLPEFPLGKNPDSKVHGTNMGPIWLRRFTSWRDRFYWNECLIWDQTSLNYIIYIYVYIYIYMYICRYTLHVVGNNFIGIVNLKADQHAVTYHM